MNSSLTETVVNLPMTCVSCGSDAQTRYCPHCGQQQVTSRHTVTTLLLGSLRRLLNVEAGLFHTLRTLSIHPERAICGYWSGATARYTHPVLYLLLAFTLFSLLGRVFGGFTGGGDVERITALALVPFVAAASRLLSYRRAFNYAEHLILVMYAFGHVALLFAAVLTVFPLAELRTTWIISAAALLGGMVYVMWTYARVFQVSVVRDAIIGLGALIVGVIGWGMLLSAFIFMIRR